MSFYILSFRIFLLNNNIFLWKIGGSMDRIVIVFIFPSRAIRLFSAYLISPLCAPILSVLAQPLFCTAVSGSCSPYLSLVFKYGWSCQATIAAVSQLELLIKIHTVRKSESTLLQVQFIHSFCLLVHRPGSWSRCKTIMRTVFLCVSVCRPRDWEAVFIASLYGRHFCCWIFILLALP
jgi:hypothetical protein